MNEIIGREGRLAFLTNSVLIVSSILTSSDLTGSGRGDHPLKLSQ
jgi:hypothetical protein